MGALAAFALLAGMSASASARAPITKYSIANGCFEVRSLASGKALGKQGGSYVADGSAAAEPFRMRATTLGRYLLYDSDRRFLAAAGDGVAVAGSPSPAAEWNVRPAGEGSFRLINQASSRPLSANAQGSLAQGAPGARGTSERFTFERVRGCEVYPEAEVRARGVPAHGESPFEQVEGFLDAHLHVMFFEAIGGRFHCGRPWHRYGVAYALPDCAEVEGPNGILAPVHNFLNYGSPVHVHDTVGWPTFRDWPRPSSLTYEGVYYKWLERAWMGGLRVLVALNTDNEGLCEIYPFKRPGYNCNEMQSVRRQIANLYELERYIDAQEGGPGKGWFRLVKNPFQARRVINRGKLAVVIGIETSKLFDCGLRNDQPLCDKAQIAERLAEAHKLGVRQMELINKFDNAFGGVAGDGEILGPIVNTANFLDTGRFWAMDTCDGHQHDREQITQTDIGLAFLPLLAPGQLPVYGPGPHCNQRGLSDLGAFLIRQMMKRGMLVDPDHLSAKARDQAMTLIESKDYSGVVSSHSWADDKTYRRVLRAGGVVTPMAKDSAGFVERWHFNRGVRSKRYRFGIGYGSDMQGLAAQGDPRNGPNPVRYPFKSFVGGVTLKRPRTGERTWDINADGVAHYGLYPDWVEDLRMIAGEPIVRDMARGAEAYLQTWERAVGVPGPGCRSRLARVSAKGIAGVPVGVGARKLLMRAGQPQKRTDVWRWCVKGGGDVRAYLMRDGHSGLVLSNAPRHTLAGVRPGMSARRLRGIATRSERGVWVAKRAAGGRGVFIVRRGKVAQVGVASNRLAPPKRGGGKGPVQPVPVG